MTTQSGTTDLVNTADSTKFIPTIADSTTYSSPADFPANRWGYKQDSGNFKKFETNTTILESGTFANADSTTLSFGSKIDYLQASGTYNTTLVFTTTINPGIGYMQDLVYGQCTTTPQVVLDKRDMKEYTIARLADGNCWMTSDLNLAGGTVLSNDLSDVPSANYYTLPDSKPAGFNDDTKSFVYNTGNETASQSNCTSSHPCNSYYSWLAATAGGKDASGNAVTGNGPDAAYSICPKGWRLPKSGDSNDTSPTSTTGYKKGDFYKLATAYGVNLESSSWDNSATFYNNAGPSTTPNFLLTGYYYNGSFDNGYANGVYWSSTSDISNKARYLSLYTSKVYSANSNGRGYGFTVRCIMQLQTMQSFTNSDAGAMAVNETRVLRDARDDKLYTVAKLADGNVWMTSNLNLAGGTVLSNDLSDVPSANYYTLPPSSSSGFSSDTTAYVYNTGNETTTQTSSANNSYYSWLAATAGGKDASGTAITGNGPDAAYSICPKGWRLPKSGDLSDTSNPTTTGYKKGDFYKLATAYGANLESSYYQNSAVFYNNAGPGTLPNFLLAGYYGSSSFYGGGAVGFYWSSSSGSITYSYGLHFNSSRVNSAYNDIRRYGFSVRCVFGS